MQEVVKEMAAAPDTPGAAPAVVPKIISLNPFTIEVCWLLAWSGGWCGVASAVLCLVLSALGTVVVRMAAELGSLANSGLNSGSTIAP